MNVAEFLAEARAAGRRYLCEDEVKEILGGVGIPVPPCLLAHNEEEAVERAGELGYPVVLKVRSPLITHKSDTGGVALNLVDSRQVRLAYREIMARARATDPAAAVTVQPMASPGREMIIGVTTDRQFGPVLMCGLGGVFTEILGDVSFRLVPVSPGVARNMIRSLRGYRLLAGYRGAPPADEEALVNILVKISDLVASYPQIQEMDLNPVVVYDRGALVLDARMVLAG
ncbi:acetyl-CoA synthetase I (NDP forming), beta subunit [Desulfofundulus kuznetsovii DSM 6115]|uniref:Acetyl-CoA synthetase I (NDP forming), beta subunit n=1 Tax=Desulfofundulus kuznetsovii (strain DSM 6115 / VKM B-1805 / 17) TaxID=760568 RepID=A0AAU8Q0M2_DESK7|nr:acetyl-CoA synthetase I (NDP forming), beta subunit [Desulfofundulus kuznetsovii DSM 6115]